MTQSSKLGLLYSTTVVFSQQLNPSAYHRAILLVALAFNFKRTTTRLTVCDNRLELPVLYGSSPQIQTLAAQFEPPHVRACCGPTDSIIEGTQTTVGRFVPTSLPSGVQEGHS